MTTLANLIFTPGYRLVNGSDLQVMVDALQGTSPYAGSFTTLTTSGEATVASFELDTGTKTASATAGAATLDKMAGVITSESLTTAAGSEYTLTLTNTDVAATDQVFASVFNGDNTGGTPCITTVAPADGSVVVIVKNIHASAAFNGTIKIAFAVFKN